MVTSQSPGVNSDNGNLIWRRTTSREADLQRLHETHPFTKKLVTKELSTKKLALTKIRKKLATKTQNPLEVLKRTVAVTVGRTIAEASTSSPANSLPGMLTPPHILLHPPLLLQKEQ